MKARVHRLLSSLARSRARFAPCALALLGACSAAVADSSGKTRPDLQPDVTLAGEAPARRGSVAAQAGQARVVFYDLLQHRADAELRLGDTTIVDFGSPGEAKYTLGGWNTRMRPGSAIDGVSVSFVSGSYGDVVLPTQGKGKKLLRLRVRAPRDGSLVAYLDDKVVAHLKSKPGEFAIHDIELPAELTPGEHMLRLRASGIGHIGAHETAFALDWLSVGTQTPPSELPLLAQTADSLAVPAGLTLGYTFKVPAGARFTATMAGQGASLLVQAVDDRLVAKTLAEQTAGKVDIDLAALAGKVVRLDLVARSALTLSSPRITVDGLAPSAAAAPIHNVLIYLIDTLRADHLKPFNPKTRVKAEGLDELVKKGSAVFTSAHTQENWTKPSVATLLSSLLPWEHNATTTEAVVPSSVQLLPERLSGLGFYSGAFIANGYVSDKFGFKQGWSTYRNYIREGRYSRAEFLAADVVEWLDKRPQEKPFMLYVHAIDPHVPYKPTAQFLNIYDPLPYDGVVDFKDDNELLEKIKIGSIKLKDRDKTHLEALYDSEISYHDLHFRSILSALDKRGLSDDTMVVVVADHGEEFWDHGSVGHGHSVYEELLRIPMVIRVPGVTSQPARVESSAGLVDIVPTVFDALGQKQPEGLSGRSLLPELRGARADAPPVVVSGFMDGWRTAVIGDLKLIQRTEKRVMVHDLAEDPHEQREVSASRPITTRYLRAQLGLALAKSAPGTGGKSRPKAEVTKIDAETEAQLKALGYVGSSRR